MSLRLLRGYFVFSALVLASLIIGCDEPKASKTTTAPAAAGKVEHAGVAIGRVTFVGTRPRLPALAVSADAHCAGRHPDGVPDESVVISDDGSLANVFVYLKDAPASDGAGREPALIDQVNCQYMPHAVAMQVNQPLRVKSSDPIFHNVHVQSIENPAMNLAEVQPGEQTVKFAKPEMMRVRCDVHPWMKAIFGVFDNPWFAVTGADGKFRIDNIPPGTYTLTAWHERFGEKTQTVRIDADGKVTQDFVYAP
ncbi:MAG TPA: carboxypeptidase regulatory-like domain-containing protein [Tepidisphaeraceae bacterium]|nr:carboxypeptidase regulatory-like domain-containing protein [Tepidisphaeraceae bacterium]